jgi:hypothetical protein
LQGLAMTDRTELVAVVSHDAGGAEILSSYVMKHGLQCLYSLAGPALKVFERKLGAVSLMPPEESIQRADWLLCGTSWQADIEWQAIRLAREYGRHSIAFLDHWGNYRERFVRNGELCLPDEIWVGDAAAEALAHRVLPEISVKQVGNPYFEDIRRDLAAIPRPGLGGKSGLSVLFVSEPLREHGLKEFGNERHWGYTEEEALHYFLSNLSVLGERVERIVIRPHPSEPPHKYDWVAREYKALPIVYEGRKTLLEEVAESDVVVGFQSMAMVVGLLAEKRVISCIPPGGKPCSLPQAEIEHLQSLQQQAR